MKIPCGVSVYIIEGILAQTERGEALPVAREDHIQF